MPTDSPGCNPARTGGEELPAAFKAFVQRFPALAAAHETIARSVDAAGPLDRRTCHLIKIGIAMGAGLESALRSHVRRAREAGATETEIEQAILLGLNTVGFPRTVAAWSWAEAPTPPRSGSPERPHVKVTVKLFGPQARLAGRREVSVDLAEPRPTCADLRRALCRADHRLGATLESSRLAINHRFARETDPVTAEDEIALIGVISGG